MTAKSPAERKQAERERKRSTGLVLRQVWIHPDDWPRLRRLIEDASKQHELDAPYTTN